MLWEMGTSCRERSRGIANVCKGPAEVAHHDNVMKAISKAISFSPTTLSSLQVGMRNTRNQLASELGGSMKKKILREKKEGVCVSSAHKVEPEILILQKKKF